MPAAEGPPLRGGARPKTKSQRKMCRFCPLPFTSCFQVYVVGLAKKKNVDKKKVGSSISMLDVCIKEIARFFSFVALPTTLLADASWFAQKKTTHERCNCYATSLSAMVEPNATLPLRRQWSSQMLLSCGALPAVRDGLKTAVSAFGRFFA